MIIIRVYLANYFFKIRKEVERYVEKYTIKYPVLLDETDALYTKYGRTGFPSLFFVDSTGKTVDKIIGSSDISVIEKSLIKLIDN